MLLHHPLSQTCQSRNPQPYSSDAFKSTDGYILLEVGAQSNHTQSYSKDGYKANREALKQEAQNIKNVLKICRIPPLTFPTVLQTVKYVSL